MKRNNLITPEGTRDLLFEDCIFRRSAEKMMHNIFKSHGYYEVVTPGLEFFDVFNLNSASLPQEILYKSTDNKGRILVLRPDSTMPIARIVATRLREEKFPLRLFYNQSVYLSNRSMTGKSNEIIQTGIELIGSSSTRADLEVLSTAIEILSGCDEEKFNLEIGDIGFFTELVNRLEISDEEKENIRCLIEMKNYPVLNDFLDDIGNNDVTKVLKQLPRLFGGVEVFDKASKLFKDEKVEKILFNLKSIYQSLQKLGSKGKITVDLGIVNRVNYYTGVVMKGYLQGYGEEVLSGGRYNKLISEFGLDVPATGFAVNVDAVAAIQQRKSEFKSRKVPDILIYGENGFEMEAIIYAEKLKKEGKIVENALFDSFEEVKKYAACMGIKSVLVIDAGGCICE